MSLESFALLFDAAVVFIVWRIAKYLRRRPHPVQNWRPSNDARSGARITLFMRAKP